MLDEGLFVAWNIFASLSKYDIVMESRDGKDIPPCDRATLRGAREKYGDCMKSDKIPVRHGATGQGTTLVAKVAVRAIWLHDCWLRSGWGMQPMSISDKAPPMRELASPTAGVGRCYA